MAIKPVPVDILPKDAVERLVAASKVDAMNRQSVPRDRAINQATTEVKRKYPQFFKE